MKDKTGETVRNAALGIAAAFFLAYVVVRAARLSMTFDEAVTFLAYIRTSFLSLFNVSTANNHLLNTWLTKLCVAIAGNGAFVLRLPNLLAYGLYLWFSIRIVKAVVPRALGFWAFLLLQLNPFLLDFFGLCRGYGLSLGFLLASVFYFLEFLRDSPAAAAGRERSLSNSLVLCALAVLANFSLLNVFLGLVVLALAVQFFENRALRGAEKAPAADVREKRRRPVLVVFILAALAYNALLTVQAALIRPGLRQPVSAAISGLNDEEQDAVIVLGTDLWGIDEPFDLEGENWSWDHPISLRRLKIMIPAAAWNRVRTISVRIGERTFSAGAEDLRQWPTARSHDDIVLETPSPLSLARSRLPFFRELINVDGPAAKSAFIRSALIGTGVAIVVLAAAAGLFRLGLVLRLFRPEQMRPVFSSVLGLAAFIAYPLTILKSSGELYYGGSEGFIPTTVGSLINGSLYGKFHGTREQNIFLVLIAASVLFGGGILIRTLRSAKTGMTPVARAGLGILGLLLLAALSVILQHRLLENPYLTGRTALFFIVLYAVFLIVSLAVLHGLGRAGRIASCGGFIVLAGLAVFHFGRSANFALVQDFRLDADTKTMIRGLETWKAAEAPERPHIDLGIGWTDLAAIEYYIVRDRLSWLTSVTRDEWQRFDHAGAFYIEVDAEAVRAELDRRGFRALNTYPHTQKILFVPSGR
jgi:hypothetical protein